MNKNISDFRLPISDLTTRQRRRPPISISPSVRLPLQIANRQSPIANSSAAFSLIEVLMAMGILAIALISIATVFPVAAFQQRRAIDDTEGVITGHNVLALVPQQYTAYANSSGATVPTVGTLSFTPVPFPSSGGTPNLDTLYSDPSGVYSYQLALRQVSSQSPVDIAVFVYRTASTPAISNTSLITPYANSTQAQNSISYEGFNSTGTPSYFVAPTIATTNGLTIWPSSSTSPSPGNMTPLSAANDLPSTTYAFIRPAFGPGDRNQLLLYVNGSNPPYVTRTVQDDVVEAAPPGAVSSSPSNISVSYLPQKAIAIVTGTYP